MNFFSNPFLYTAVFQCLTVDCRGNYVKLLLNSSEYPLQLGTNEQRNETI